MSSERHEHHEPANGPDANDPQEIDRILDEAAGLSNSIGNEIGAEHPPADQPHGADDDAMDVETHLAKVEELLRGVTDEPPDAHPSDAPPPRQPPHGEQAETTSPAGDETPSATAAHDQTPGAYEPGDRPRGDAPTNPAADETPDDAPSLHRGVQDEPARDHAAHDQHDSGGTDAPVRELRQPAAERSQPMPDPQPRPIIEGGAPDAQECHSVALDDPPPKQTPPNALDVPAIPDEPPTIPLDDHVPQPRARRLARWYWLESAAATWDAISEGALNLLDAVDRLFTWIDYGARRVLGWIALVMTVAAMAIAAYSLA